MNEQTILNEVKALKNDLKNGDEIITQISGGGKEIKTSKKVGDARIKVMNMVKEAMMNKHIDGAEAGRLTRLFGTKTTSMYWIK